MVVLMSKILFGLNYDFWLPSLVEVVWEYAVSRVFTWAFLPQWLVLPSQVANEGSSNYRIELSKLYIQEPEEIATGFVHVRHLRWTWTQTLSPGEDTKGVEEITHNRTDENFSNTNI